MTTIKINNRSPLAFASAAERAMGRLMRSPDGHAAAADGAAAAAPDAAAGDAAAGDAAGAADGAEQVTSLAGDATTAGKPAEGDAAAAGEADGGEVKDGEGEGAGEKIVVLGAPEKYELTAPEGMTFDAEAFGKVEPILRELDLSAPAAQRLVDAYAGEVVPLLMERAQAQVTAKTEENNASYRKSLADEARADPEIGGANFDRTIDEVAQVWERFGIKKGEGFRQLLDDSGIGNHPDMLRFLSRVGKSVGEGGFVSSDGAAGGGRKSDKEVFYPSMAK